MVRKRIAGKAGMNLAMITDEETTAGFVLAGAGQVDAQGRSNFISVTPNTRLSDIETAFTSYTTNPNVSIVLVTQTVAAQIRHLIDEYTKSGQVVPTILEIPSKETPYDPNKDAVMQRVKVFFGDNFQF